MSPNRTLMVHYLNISLQTPLVDQEDFDAVFHNLSGGNYRLRRAIYHRMIARRKELQDERTEFATYDEYISACSQLPQELMLHILHVHQVPRGWSQDAYGPFPAQGLILVSTRLPSANRSMANP